MQKRRARFQLRVDREAMKKIKEIARKAKRTVTSLLTEAVNDLLVKYGQKPVAEERRIGRPKKS